MRSKHKEGTLGSRLSGGLLLGAQPTAPLTFTVSFGIYVQIFAEHLSRVSKSAFMHKTTIFFKTKLEMEG